MKFEDNVHLYEGEILGDRASGVDIYIGSVKELSHESDQAGKFLPIAY